MRGNENISGIVECVDAAVDGRGASGHPLNDGLEHWNCDIEKLFGMH
jgi:hypothetical protein